MPCAPRPPSGRPPHLRACTPFAPPAASPQIVFSDSWWVGTKEENPQEHKLPMPTELATARTHTDYDFSYGAAGAGGASLGVLMETVLQVKHNSMVWVSGQGQGRCVGRVLLGARAPPGGLRRAGGTRLHARSRAAGGLRLLLRCSAHLRSAAVRVPARAPTAARGLGTCCAARHALRPRHVTHAACAVRLPCCAAPGGRAGQGKGASQPGLASPGKPSQPLSQGDGPGVSAAAQRPACWPCCGLRPAAACCARLPSAF